MEPSNEPFIQKPFAGRAASVALALLMLPFAGVALFLSLQGAWEAGSAGLLARLSPRALKTLAALFFALVTLDFFLFYLFFRRVSARLREIAGAVDALADGRSAPALPADPADEIGALAAGVNRLAARLDYEETRRVYKTARPPARYAPPESGGESRFVGIMAVEIEDWEEKARRVSGKRLIALLAKYYEIVSDCVQKTGGILESHGAARAVIIWGGLEKRKEPERDAYDALRCALLIRHAAYRYNGRQKNGDLRVKINMGIHSGVVGAALINVNERPEFKVTGGSLETARACARMGRACRFDIILSAAAYDLTEGHAITCAVTPPGSGGAGEPQSAYALVNVKTGSRRYQKHPRTVSDVRAVMKWDTGEGA